MNPQDFLSSVKPVMEKSGVDLILITKMANIRYLTGFTGTSAYILLSEDKALFITDPRYTLQAKSQCEGWEVVELRGKKLTEFIKENFSFDKVGVDEWITAGAFERLKDGLKTEVLVIKDIVEPLRAKKSDFEADRIKKAINIAKEAFFEVLDIVGEGIKERDVQIELEYNMKKMGAGAVSFDIIVAAGERSALPHGVASGREIKKGDIILFDFGCVFEGYCSDITRVVKLGRLSDEEKRIWQLVSDAKRIAFEYIGESMGKKLSARELHNKVVSYFESHGVDNYFGHGLGHGIGIEVHEKPTISSFSEDVIEAGNVFTIEPGLYFDGKFGIRLEDIVYVSFDSLVNLTDMEDEVIVL